MLTGFLSGYPVGAKVTSDLVRDGRISRQEGAYLLSFCNNTSPGFLAGFVVCQTIRDPSLVLGTMIVFFAVPILFSFLFRKIYSPKSVGWKSQPLIRTQRIVSLDLFDTSIMNGFETITKIGGYIIVFSVLLELTKMLPLADTLAGQIGLSFLRNNERCGDTGDTSFSICGSICLNHGIVYIWGIVCGCTDKWNVDWKWTSDPAIHHRKTGCRSGSQSLGLFLYSDIRDVITPPSPVRILFLSHPGS
ncbi:MAG: hypothetical protein ACLUUO_08040 [Sellimonas intestinalis]